jgi:thiol-disulfide isomerase/thioredoxin
MKSILLLLVSILIINGLNAQTKGVKFEEITLLEAVNKAKSSKKVKKLIFIDCYTTWCGPCKDMANNIFPQEICGNFFNANFINVTFDMEKGEGLEIAKKYAVAVYPTFLILDADGKEINRVIGSDKAESFIGKVKLAMDPANTPDARMELYRANKSTDNLFGVLETLKNAYKNKELNTFVDEVFFTLEPSVQFNEKLWKIITSPAGAMSNTNSTIFRYTLLNKYEADRYITKAKVDEHLLKIFKVYLMRYTSGNLMQDSDTNYELNVICANTLADGDAGLEYLLKMTLLKKSNKMDELMNMLSYPQIFRFTRLDIEMIEKSISENKNLSADQKLKVSKYFSEKSDFLAKEADYAKRTSGKFNNSK